MKAILILIIVCCFTSCSNVYFTEPQPIGVTNLNEIPDDIIGEYQVPILGYSDSGNNIIIKKNKIIDGDGRETFLSDSLIVRKLNDYYVINKRENSQKNPSLKGYWEVYLVKTNDCDNLEVTGFSIPNNFNEETLTYFTDKYDAIVIKQESTWGMEMEEEMGEMKEMEMEEMEMEMEMEEMEMEMEEMEMEMEEMEMEEMEEMEVKEEMSIEALVLKMTKKEFSEYINSSKVANPIILKNIKNK